jgi:hypothetical protein
VGVKKKNDRKGLTSAIKFYGHAFGSVLCKVRVKACMICSFGFLSAVASVNLIFKPLHEKNSFSAFYESCTFLLPSEQAVSVVCVIKSHYLSVDCGHWPSWLQHVY